MPEERFGEPVRIGGEHLLCGRKKRSQTLSTD
jgi:hypothetical protein